MPKLHMHQLQNTHEYMNTHMHITHITNIFRIDETNPYIGEQIKIFVWNAQVMYKLSIQCAQL